jgi:hypothetical protein
VSYSCENFGGTEDNLLGERTLSTGIGFGCKFGSTPVKKQWDYCGRDSDTIVEFIGLMERIAAHHLQFLSHTVGYNSHA